MGEAVSPMAAAFATLVFATHLLVHATSLPTAPGITQCLVGSAGIERCIANSLNTYIPLFSNGWGEEVPALDPLMLPFIETDYDDGNITVSLRLKNVVITGLARTRVYIVRAKSLEEGKLELMCKTAQITATGVYNSEGAVITFPLHSSGPFNITLGDLTSHLIVHMEVVKGHIHVSDIGLSVMPAQIDIQAGQQLDEQNSLGAALNVYLNENSFELYELMRPRLANYFSEMFKEIVNNLLEETPVSLIFPNLNLRK